LRASVIRVLSSGEWPTRSIAEVCDPSRKIAYGVLQPGKHVPGGTPLVRVSDIDDGHVRLGNLKVIDPSIADKYPRTRLSGGEVLLTIVGTIGRSAVVPEVLAGANVARAVAVIPVRADFSSEFVSLALGTHQSKARLVGLAHEVARKTLNLEDVRSFQLAVPPLAEQRRIASLVSEHLSLIEALRSELETAHLRSAGLRRSVLRDAFKGRLLAPGQPDKSTAMANERPLAKRHCAAELAD
jgi:type I restriction enzyme S subunit